MNSKRMVQALLLSCLAGCTGNVNDGNSNTIVTLLVSRNSQGAPGNDDSNQISVSDDGRYIVFVSEATNLVPGDENGNSDLFLHDSQTGTQVLLVELASHPSLSGDGRFVAYVKDSAIRVRELENGADTRVDISSTGALANAASDFPSISKDGRFVAFDSAATNLTGASDNNADDDIFVHDRISGLTTLISKSVLVNAPAGDDKSELPSISGDGRFVAFESLASDLVEGITVANAVKDIYVHDRSTGKNSLITKKHTGSLATAESIYSSISSDGGFIVFLSFEKDLVAGDFYLGPDVFVHNRVGGTNSRVSVSSSGGSGFLGGIIYDPDANPRPSISGDGRYAAFLFGSLSVEDNNLNYDDIYKHDTWSGTTSLVDVATGGAPQGNNSPKEVVISSDGHTVIFVSVSTNLVEYHLPGLVEQVFKRGPN